MNQTELIQGLSAFPYPRQDYWLVAGSAMVLHGFKAETADIDLGCTPCLADLLEAEGFLAGRTADGLRWFRYGAEIEIFEAWGQESVIQHKGFSVLSVEGLLAMKRELGREKDLQDIARILSRYHPEAKLP